MYRNPHASERPKMDTPVYFLVATIDGCPAVAAEMPNGEKKVVAIMLNTDLGHELAETLVEIKNRGKVVL